MHKNDAQREFARLALTMNQRKRLHFDHIEKPASWVPILALPRGYIDRIACIKSDLRRDSELRLACVLRKLRISLDSKCNYDFNSVCVCSQATISARESNPTHRSPSNTGI